MKKTITKTRTFFLSLAVLIGTGLSAQTVYTVSSDLNSGVGTLRQLIIDAAPGDSIVIPENYTIVLAIDIAFSKDLKINGQGSLVKVAEPGVSNWRVFTLGTTASTATTVSMYNLNLEGGKLATAFGATIYVNQNHTFTMKHCTISKGKATYCGGLFINKSVINSTTLEDCTFNDNESTTANGGAFFVRGQFSIKNCTFSNNKADLNGGAVACYEATSPCLISNCRFIGNITHAPSGGALINYSTTNSVDLENCTFESNTNTIYKTYITGAGAFAIASATAKSTLTNCTFYNNTGTTSGAIFNAKGTLKAVNCTFAGNSTPSTNSGAYHDINHADAKTTFVNCIFAYNYNSAGLMDIFVTTLGTVSGEKNIVGAVSGTPSYTNSVAFSYDPASDLFDSYTITGPLMPILADNGGLTKTIALSNTSIANGSGLATFGDPNIVPVKDQRGEVRASTPGIGSYEYEIVTGIATINKPDFNVYQNSASDVLNIKGSVLVTRLDIIDLSGKMVLSVSKPMSTVSLNGISRGMYLVHIATLEGDVIRKISIL